MNKQVSNDVRLIVSDVEYGGWEKVEVTLSIDAIAGAFELTLTDPWLPTATPWPLVDGDSCQLLIGSDVVIDGYIDKIVSKLSGDEHELTVSGRDRTCDIVDCSAVNVPGEWRNRKTEQIAADICAPYNVQVVCDVDTGPPISLFRLQPAERCVDAIERLCKGQGVIILTGGAGKLHITQISQLQVAPQNGGVALVEGVNILDVEHTTSSEEQYSRYVVKAYAQEKKDTSADPQGGVYLVR